MRSSRLWSAALRVRKTGEASKIQQAWARNSLPFFFQSGRVPVNDRSFLQIVLYLRLLRFQIEACGLWCLVLPYLFGLFEPFLVPCCYFVAFDSFLLDVLSLAADFREQRVGVF